VQANGVVLKAGDAMKAVDEKEIRISGGKDAEVLLFDMA
jgi:hypothetical protein